MTAAATTSPARTAPAADVATPWWLRPWPLDATETILAAVVRIGYQDTWYDLATTRHFPGELGVLRYDARE